MSRPRRRPIAALALGTVLVTLLAGPASAATPLVKMTIRVDPNPAVPGATVRYVGTVTPVRGTPTNVRVRMESSPGPFPGGSSCSPSANCDEGGGATWTFPTLTSTKTVRFTTMANPAWTVRFFLIGGNAGCSGTCPPSVRSVGATVKTSLSWASGAQVTTGTTIRVTAIASATAGPMEGLLQVALPPGVDPPTDLPPGALYSPSPAHYVDNVQILGNAASYSFDVVINAPNGSSLPFVVRFWAANGQTPHASSTTYVKVGSDSTDPTASAPKWSLSTGAALDSGRIPVRLSWSGSDGGSGVERYQLARSTDGGAWVTDPVEPLGAAANRLLSSGHRYRFRVRAIDHAGNISSWATGTTFTLTAYTEASSTLRYGGTWSTVSAPTYRGGKAKSTTTAGKSVSHTSTSRSFAWLAPRGPGMGKAKVYVNGTLVATVDLWASEAYPQRLVWAKSWTTTASRTVRIVAQGTAGFPRVTLDGVITLR